jgi:hypothetical protein
VRITRIYTNRSSNILPSWHVVYEWEDIFAQKLRAKMIGYGDEDNIFHRRNIKKKLINSYKLNNIRFELRKVLPINPKHKLIFFLSPPPEYSFLTNCNVIPVIIDFWKQTDLKRLNIIFKNTKFVFVTSLEAYNYLKTVDCQFKIKHLPISISDIYKPTTYPEKDIDIIQIGRQNSVINAFMEKLLDKYPHIEYVSQNKEKGMFNYFSNKRGNLGSFTNREDFLKILKRSKISLMSSPGVDNGAMRTGGFNPVTPRFLESAANYCYMLGRYVNNEDFNYFGISEICHEINDYNLFEKTILSMLSSKFNKFVEYNAFLERHYTSKRVELFLEEIKHNK